LRQHFGGFAQGRAAGLSLRHDHGSQSMSDACQGELTFLGIESSPALVRALEGNGCAKGFIRPLKENLPGLRTFDTVGQLRQAPLELRRICNSTWLIKRHAFRPPDAVRQDQLSTAALAASAATRCLSRRRRYIPQDPVHDSCLCRPDCSMIR
jgi:hypothetical protein